MSVFDVPLLEGTSLSVLDETITCDNTKCGSRVPFDGHEPYTTSAVDHSLRDGATAETHETFTRSHINPGPEEPFDGHESPTISASDAGRCTAPLSSAFPSELAATLRPRSPSGDCVALTQSTPPIDHRSYQDPCPSQLTQCDVTPPHLSPIMGLAESSTNAVSASYTQTEIINQYVDALDAATHQFGLRWTEAERTWPHDASLQSAPGLVDRLAIARAGASISGTRRGLSIVQSTLDDWQDTRTKDKWDTAKAPPASEAKPERTSTERRADVPLKDPPARSTTTREPSLLSKADQTARIAVSVATAISIGLGVYHGSFMSKARHR